MRPSWRVRNGRFGPDSPARRSALKVVVGLGNPGRQYEHTRHNVGWMVLDRLADRAGWGGTVKARDAAAVARGRYRGLDLVLVKPTTFMNESGVAVRKVLARERAPLEDMLVVVDDFALPFGRLRMRERGSAGSHNGLRSIIGELQNENFARLRVGIGDPARDAVRHVLTRFSDAERNTLEHVLDAAADAVEDWAREGSARAANRWNTWQLPGEGSPEADLAAREPPSNAHGAALERRSDTDGPAREGPSEQPPERAVRRTRTGWRRLLPG
jgi:PTH1 family peptidyl-tRNA hydrolase